MWSRIAASAALGASVSVLIFFLLPAAMTMGQDEFGRSYYDGGLATIFFVFGACLGAWRCVDAAPAVVRRTKHRPRRHRVYRRCIGRLMHRRTAPPLVPCPA